MLSRQNFQCVLLQLKVVEKKQLAATTTFLGVIYSINIQIYIYIYIYEPAAFRVHLTLNFSYLLSIHNRNLYVYLSPINMYSLGFRVWGLRFRVLGLKVLGLGFRL